MPWLAERNVNVVDSDSSLLRSACTKSKNLRSKSNRSSSPGVSINLYTKQYPIPPILRRRPSARRTSYRPFVDTTANYATNRHALCPNAPVAGRDIKKTAALQAKNVRQSVEPAQPNWDCKIVRGNSFKCFYNNRPLSSSTNPKKIYLKRLPGQRNMRTIRRRESTSKYPRKRSSLITASSRNTGNAGYDLRERTDLSTINHLKNAGRGAVIIQAFHREA